MDERAKKLKELDEEDLRLIDNGISLLAARHKVEEKQKQAGKKSSAAGSQPVLISAT